MKNKNECDIVKDLMVGYKEDLLNSTSKNLVKEHLQECEECKKYYDILDSDELENYSNQKNKDKIEVNYLKKIRSHINILRLFIIVILISIISIIFLTLIKYYRFVNIFEKAYDRTEYMKQLDNYKLEHRTIFKNFLSNNRSYDVTFSYYYKDGKYKFQYGDSSTTYLQDDSYKKISVHDDIKQIVFYTQDFIEEKKGNTINKYWRVINYKNMYTFFNVIGMSFREDSFNGMQCYVIRRGDSDYYEDIWIEKNTFMLVRTVLERKGKTYSEEIYTFTENGTSDEDVNTEILNTEKYKDYNRIEIENNATEEVKLYYEILNKKK